eukprot:CAMPEP_0114453628 /NCGR_PEP_ID=MMETSP0104-20121206/2150_1 /TAXON_ID=37642 ORGANISM="Paraphysomonas imperforata, Strain PA2" /NCGR_SAMPLE_ID=MMETSP0104 /ASSEMBLY_ACC=CAM_ASM_000202 /LENGTH=93 /DNA_ID=CAMNT_0001625959 /DNA_START=342 /DNA_END=624 /DNA_ORIENTATION=+
MSLTPVQRALLLQQLGQAVQHLAHVGPVSKVWRPADLYEADEGLYLRAGPAALFIGAQHNLRRGTHVTSHHLVFKLLAGEPREGHTASHHLPH